ncbi:MAG TPA: ATP-grasp domain-containing protein [Longimicrobiaceae bacterium]|nr:ATP-grasp domain-containing protein [Longimicrobiaceae bacterium]
MSSQAMPGPTCYISGVHSGPNPSPGLGVALSLRQAFPRAHLVAVDYSVESSGLHSEVFDDVWVQRPWKELDLAVYRAAIQERLDEGAFWFAGQDLEVQWLAETLPSRARALVAPAAALREIAKPGISAARDLPFAVPEFVPVDRSDWELHGFCREHGWQVWLKGPNYEAVRVRDWPGFRYARSLLGELWSTDRLFVQRHIPGNEESIAFCAYAGELLDCVHMRKHAQTVEGKTWAGRVSEVEPGMVEPLREVVARLEWTGGAELEFVRGMDGTLQLIDWNSRFPAWIHAASFAGHNLPARLAEAAGCGGAAAAPFRASQFTRVVVEIPVRPTHPLPAVKPPPDEWQVGSKHPSGMPQLAKRLRGETREDEERERPAPEIPDAVRRDLFRFAAEEFPTPRRILLPLAARERFARVEEALAASAGTGAELRFGYSVKTNPHPSLLALARSAGMLAEVISAAELRQALAAGFPPEQVVVNGPAQQWPGGGTVEGTLMAAFADSPQTFERWLDEGPPSARYLGIRLRPYPVESRFGTSVSHPRRFAGVLALLKRLPPAQALGVHFHFASDVLGPARWREVYEGVIYWARAIQEGTGRPVRCLDVGGGWFPDDFDRELLPRLPELVGAASELLPALESFMVEPGKAVAQPSMALVTTVLEVRRRKRGGEAVVDAAISDLPMAPLYPHRVYARSPGGEWTALAGGRCRLVGRICMETDILAGEVALPEWIEPGDRLVIGDAGAYDASMAYNFGRGVLDDACD